MAAYGTPSMNYSCSDVQIRKSAHAFKNYQMLALKNDCSIKGTTTNVDHDSSFIDPCSGLARI